MIELEEKYQDINNYTTSIFQESGSSYVIKDNMNKPMIAMESVKDAVIGKLYELNAKKISKLDKSYNSLFDCGGDIRKHPKFSVLEDTIKTLEKLKTDNNINDKWLELLIEAYNRLVLDANIFVPAFKAGNELARQYFFSTSMSVITLTTFVVNVMIIVRQTPNSPAELVYDVNDKAWRGAPRFTREMLQQYVKFSASGKLKKDIEASSHILVSQEDFSTEGALGTFMGNHRILTTAVIAVFVFAAVGPMVRHIIYTIATIKQNLYDYFENMEHLLAVNVAKLEDDAAPINVINKQKKYIALMGKFKALFIKDMMVAERAGTKELSDEEKATVKDTESNSDSDPDIVF